MARIKSHHQGPGDPPPRSNRRKRGASSPAPTDSSQPTAESSQRAASVFSQRTGSPDPEDDAPHGRKKRVKRALMDDHDQLNQELQDAVNHTHPSVEPVTHDNVQVVINTKPQKRARFSEPPPVIEQESTTPDATPPRPVSQAPAGLTPHLARIGASQPSKSGRHARFSLPATLDNGDDGTTNGDEDVREIQFTPLRAVLDGRIKRRLRRSHLSEEVNEFEEHKKDDARDKKELRELRRKVLQKDEREKELMLELELQRQLSIDITDHDKIKDLESELNEVRQELTDLKAQSVFSGSDRAFSEDPGMDFDMDDGVNYDDEEEELILVDPDDINVSQEDMRAEPHANGFYSSQSSFSLSRITNSQSVSEHASQVKLPNPAHEADLRNFEEALGNLRRELSDARSALEIFTLELQGLGFAEDHASADVILQSLRASFRQARIELEVLLPGAAPPDLKNGALLKALTDHIHGLMAELREKTELAEKHNQMEKTLQAQNNGLLDKLAEFESRNTTLEHQWNTLDAQNDENVKTITDIENELQTMHTALDQSDKDNMEKDIKINGLEDEVADQSLSIQRLQKALEDYRSDVSKLDNLVSSMEQDHNAKIEEMEENHADAISDLNLQLASETEAREIAEGESDQKTAFINDLEAKIDATEIDVETIREELRQMQDSNEAEKTNREAAEAQVEKQSTLIASLEEDLERAEDCLGTLRAELEELRSLADSERKQREAAEEDLDDRNAQIAELETKLRDEGIQANELRSKLFEVQNRMDTEVAELKADVKARDEYYIKKVDDQTSRAKDAENESARRNVLIAELELDIAKKEEAAEKLQEEHDELVNARDEEIARLTENLATLENDYSSLKQSSDLQITTLQATITDLTDTIRARDETIAILQDEAIAAAEQHQFITEQQDSKIDTLTTDLALARTEIEKLFKLKTSLEERVDNTSTELLRIVNDHTNERDALMDTISARNAEIANLTTDAQQRAEAFETEISQKENELEGLRIVADARAVDITALVAQVEELKEAFRTQQRDGEETVAALREGMRAAVERADGLAASYGDRAAETRRVVDSMQVAGVKVTGAKFDLQRVVEGKVGKVKEKVRVQRKGRKARRIFDSGIGVEEDEEAEEEAVNGV